MVKIRSIEIQWTTPIMNAVAKFGYSIGLKLFPIETTVLNVSTNTFNGWVVDHSL